MHSGARTSSSQRWFLRSWRLHWACCRISFKRRDWDRTVLAPACLLLLGLPSLLHSAARSGWLSKDLPPASAAGDPCFSPLFLPPSASHEEGSQVLGLGPGPLPNRPFPRLFQLYLWQAKRDPVSGTCVYACTWAHAHMRLPARLPPYRCMLPPGLRESVCVCLYIRLCVFACVCMCLHVVCVYTCVCWSSLAAGEHVVGSRAHLSSL